MPRRRRPATLHRLVRQLAAREDLWHSHVGFDRKARHAVRVASAADYELTTVRLYTIGEGGWPRTVAAESRGVDW